MTPKILSAAELFGSWLDDVERGEPPARFSLPDPFAELDVAPGRLLFFGGAPGGGKTAAAMQVTVDLLRLNPTARVLVANVEMAPRLLVERIVSRLSGVPLTRIVERTLTASELERVRLAVAALKPDAGRLAFLAAPFDLKHVADAGTAFDANVLVLDYIQRFTVVGGGTDKREQLETAATVLRQFCDAGAAVLVASAVARQKGANGSTYRGLNLASFRGSSELEYGCDSAYLFAPGDCGAITLTCEKNRFGPVADIVTRFDPVTQTFHPAPAGLGEFDAAPAARPRRNTRVGGPAACDD